MKSKVGEVRPTQLLHTHGVGAMIDLPHFAALVMGLDDWETVHAALVTEERLLRAVRAQLGSQVQELRLPPTEPETQTPLAGPPIGVPVVPFPQWFRCPRCDHLAPQSSGLFDLKTDPYRPERARYVHVNWIEKVVLVERLREVRALTGFTRIDSPGDDSDPTEIPPGLVAPIARGRVTWVPVSEVRGEGLFIQLREDRVRAWCALATRRDAELRAAHAAWRRSRGIPTPDAGYPGLRYALIHSLSHALIRQLAIELGYSSASIRERIFASGGTGSTGPTVGLLLYTAAPDSEGTLGGLVALGAPHKLGYLLRQALESIRLCASDPLCAEHEPESSGHITLHGAACHACLFASETSCERGNKYLDRALLMRVMGSAHEGFFEPVTS